MSRLRTSFAALSVATLLALTGCSGQDMKRSGFGAGFLVRVRGSDYGKKVFEGAA